MAWRTGTAAQDEYARIGGVLRAAREGLGYSQLRLAGEIGVSEATYSRYEAGKQKITIPELKRVAALLGLPLEAVLGAPAAAPPLVPDIAERVADKLAERLPAIVRAVLAEHREPPGGAWGGSPGEGRPFPPSAGSPRAGRTGSLEGEPLHSTDKSHEARPASWPGRVQLAHAG